MCARVIFLLVFCFESTFFGSSFSGSIFLWFEIIFSVWFYISLWRNASDHSINVGKLSLRKILVVVGYSNYWLTAAAVFLLGFSFHYLRHLTLMIIFAINPHVRYLCVFFSSACFLAPILVIPPKIDSSKWLCFERKNVNDIILTMCLNRFTAWLWWSQNWEFWKKKKIKMLFLANRN